MITIQFLDSDKDDEQLVSMTNEYGDRHSGPVALALTGDQSFRLAQLLEAAYTLGAKEQAHRFQRQQEDSVPTPATTIRTPSDGL